MSHHEQTRAPTARRQSGLRATWKEWVGLALLVAPMLMVASDLTVLFLALPTVSADLEPSASQGLWITHIYGFVIAGLLVTAGRVGDRIGPRRLLLIGAAAFGLFSVAAAYSVSPEMLIISRALLGAAGATLMPSLFSLVRVMFADETQRRLAVGIMLSSFSVGMAIGPLLGGALLELFWWGSVFLINLPFMALLVLLGRRLLPERAERNASRIDLPSILLSMAGILAMVYGLQELAAGQETGEGSVWPHLAIAIAGVLVLGIFVRRQHRLAEPLLDLTLLRRPPVAASLGSLLLVSLGVLGMYFLLTQYLQLVVGLDPLGAGVATLPYALVNIVGAMIAPRLTRHLRPAVLVALGLGIAAAGAALLAVSADPGTPVVVILAALSVIGFGQGIAFVLIVDLIISSAPSDKTGSVSAAQEVSAELGGALGIAAGGAVGTVIYRAHLDAALPSDVPEASAEAALASLYSGVTTAEDLGAGGLALLEAVHHSIAAGLQSYAALGVVLIGLATVLITAVLAVRGHAPRPLPEDLQHEHASGTVEGAR